MNIVLVKLLGSLVDVTVPLKRGKTHKNKKKKKTNQKKKTKKRPNKQAKSIKVQL